MTADLLIVVPTRGRPDSIRRLVGAWQATQAAGADLMIVYDADDPCCDEYTTIAHDAGLLAHINPTQTPLVPSLHAGITSTAGQYEAVGCMGDDHVPRTVDWPGTYLAALRELGTGIVYGDDLHRSEDLCTQWAMTADIIAALGGRMVPAPVAHQFCDRSVMDLGRAAGCLRYLPNVVVEHLHYRAGKAVKDEHYARVNAKTLYLQDKVSYEWWLANGLASDAAAVRRIRGGKAA